MDTAAPKAAARLSPAEITAFFDRVIAPKIIDIEAARHKAAGSFWWRATLAVFINCAAATFVLTDMFSAVPMLGTPQQVGDIALQGFLFSVIGFATFASMPLVKFKTSTKNQLMADIISIFPGFHYQLERKFPEDLIRQSAIFPSYKHDKGGDFIEGQYRDVAVTSANVKLMDVSTDSRGRKRETTAFEGPVYHLSFPRNFQGTTRVRRDGGWLGNTVGGWFAGLERVALEDPEFENVFEVYSTNQVEARYILTTGFMELLLRVAARHKNKLEAAFFGQHVLLKVRGQAARLQITNPLRRIDWPREVARLVDEFQDAFALVDELKLNQKIGL